MSMANIHHAFSRKTVAIAIASTVAMGGGVQVVGPELGLDTVGTASAAETIPANNIDVSITTNEGNDLMKYPQKKVRVQNESNDFYKKFNRKDATLKINVTIPNSAKVGDTVTVNLNGIALDEGVPRGTSILKIEGDDAVKVNTENRTVTFELLPAADKYLGRIAEFETFVDFKRVYSDHTRTQTDYEKRGTTETEEDQDHFGVSIGDVFRGVTTTYFTTIKYIFEPSTFYLNYRIYARFKSPMLETGTASGVYKHALFAPDIDRYKLNRLIPMHDDEFRVKPRTPASRTVTVRFSTDDPDAIPVITNPTFNLRDLSLADEENRNHIAGRYVTRDGQLATAKDKVLYIPWQKDFTSKVTGTAKVEGKDIVMTFKNVAAGETLDLYTSKFVDQVAHFEHPYQVGKTVTNTIKTDNGGVGMVKLTDTESFTMASINGWADGYIPKSDIIFKVDANGKEADTQSQAASVTNDKAKFTATLTNNGQIGERFVIIDFPKGVTDKDGNTRKVVNFGNEGFSIGATKTIDLGELNVPEGVNQNEFKATLPNQFRQDKKVPLFDNAWTTDAAPAKSVTPKYKDTTAPRKGSTTVPAPTGGAPGATYGPGTNVPSWAKVNPDGTITLTPGKTAPAGDTTINVKVTYPNGYTGPATIPAKVTVPEAVDPTDGVGNELELHITDIVKQKNGDYLVTRNDGKKWTIKTGDLEKRIKDLEDKKSPSAEDFKKVQDDLKGVQDKIADLEKATSDNKKAIDDLKKDVDGLKDRVDDLEGRVDKLEKAGIKEVKDDGKGNYTLIRNDGSTVNAVIKTSDNIKQIIPNKDGSITIVKVDGSKEKVDLAQVKIVEKDKGTPEHTITITTPDGQSVTFNVFDKHITNVKKLANGDYEITRNDGKKWTVKLSDIRDAIKALEDKDSPTRDEFNQVKDDITKIRIDVAQNAANIADNAGDILQLNRDLDALDKRVDGIEGRVKKLEDNAIKEVKDDGKGNYTLIRENGEKVNAAIKTGDNVKQIVPNKDGSITIVKVDGTKEKVKLSQVKITEQNVGKPNHTITITTPDGQMVTFDAYDNHVVDVKKLANGDYEVSRNDGKKWTIKLDDIRKKIADLEAKDSPTRDEFKAVQDDIKAIQDEVADLTKQVNENAEGIADLVADVDGLDKRVTDLEGRVDKLEANGIKEVKDDGKGNYTLIRNDGSEVNAVIKTGDSVTGITDNGDGSITLNKKDGSKEKVNLSQVKITENKKGTPEHTVTITTPAGDTVTFNVFDKYVVDVKKNKDGNYDIYRSDIEGGKKVWKTIDISDLRKQIAALEKKDSPSRAEFDALVKKIVNLQVEINEKFVNVQGDIDQLKADLGDLDARLKSLEARVGKLEETDEAWAKCYSGISTAALPALIALPIGLLSQVKIPGIAEMNTNIQKQIGLYNPELAKAWERNGGILQAVGAVALLGGVIGAIVHASKACAPYNETDAVKNTDIGKLHAKVKEGSSKRVERKASKKEVEAPTPAPETVTPDIESETPKAQSKEESAA